MKILKRISAMILSVLMLGTCLALPKGETSMDTTTDVPSQQTGPVVTPVEKPSTNAVTAKKYYVDVNNLGGVGASFICNNTALTQGESMTMTYTVQAKSSLADNTTTEQRFAGVFAKSNLSQAYPVVGTAENNVTAFDSFQINGADLNRTNAPTLPDTHFGVGSTYALTLTPQSNNATYDWTLTKDGTQVSAGTAGYNAYMGIMIYHYQTYRFTLSNVTISTETKDLGVFAYNNGSVNHNSKVIDGDKEMPIVTLASENVSVNGATATIVNTMGYMGSNSVQLSASNPTVYLYLDGLDDYATSARVHVSLRLYLEITTDSATSTTWYSPIEVKKEGGLSVDSDLPRNTWNLISYDTVILKRNGRNCVQLSITGNAGEVMYISAPQISADQSEEKYTLGGCEVYQLNGVGLSESYVIITPTDEVIVIDGGDTADASNLYNFITQYTHKVDHWFVSHYHGDHCGALVTMLQNPIYDFVIENLHYNFPTQTQCQAGFEYIDSVVPSFDITTGNETPSMVERKNVLDNTANTKILNRVTSNKGQVYSFGDTCKFKVISDPYFDVNTNYGNNTSLMYKLETADENVLFLNDIGDYGDTCILENKTINYTDGTSATFREEIADCAYVQLGHHGQAGPSLNFYNYCTDMRICLYSAVDWVMNCDNGNGLNSATNLVTLATRDFMREKGIYKYYSHEHGRVKLV